MYNHKKKCHYKESENKIINIENDNINYKELVMKLLVDNQEIIKENQKSVLDGYALFLIL